MPSTYAIVPALQGTVALILDVDIRSLIQLTNGRGRDFVPHSASVMFFTYRTDTPARYILIFHATFPAAIPLNNSSLKGNFFKPWHLECDISRGGGEITTIVLVR